MNLAEAHCQHRLIRRDPGCAAVTGKSTGSAPVPVSTQILPVRVRWRVALQPDLCSTQPDPPQPSRGGLLMFDDQQQEVDALMGQNGEFRSLFMKHRELDKQVRDAELGVLPVDDLTLVKLKKQKLMAKDKLTHLWNARHSAA